MGYSRGGEKKTARKWGSPGIWEIRRTKENLIKKRCGGGGLFLLMQTDLECKSTGFGERKKLYVEVLKGLRVQGGNKHQKIVGRTFKKKHKKNRAVAKGGRTRQERGKGGLENTGRENKKKVPPLKQTGLRQTPQPPKG